MSKEAMKQALEALQRIDLWLKARYQVGLVGVELDAIKALEEALANHCEDNLDMVKQKKKRPQNCGTSYCSCIECVMQQEQGEPVAWELGAEVYWGDSPEMSDYVRKNGTPLFTKQQQRKPLTDEQSEALIEDLAEWSRHVEVDTAHESLEKHVCRVLIAHGIKE